MLTLNKVSFGYGNATILRDVSLALPKQGAVCFTAPSGTGKTTLLRLLAGLEQPQGGTVETHEARIAVVFQEHRLLPWLTARENVSLVCTNEEAEAYLAAVGLADAQDKYPSQLSGGMQRRVALARALAYGGDVLLLDEPFNGLDSELRQTVASAIKKRFADGCIVLVTHTPEDAALLDATVVPLTFPLSGPINI